MTKDHDPQDRFGFTDSEIIAVIMAHRGVIRFGCYVPTREEVATQSAEWLQNIIIDWWWECRPSSFQPMRRSTTFLRSCVGAMTRTARQSRS